MACDAGAADCAYSNQPYETPAMVKSLDALLIAGLLFATAWSWWPSSHAATAPTRSSTTAGAPPTAATASPASSDRALCRLRGRLLGRDGLPIRHVAVRIATPDDGRYARVAATTTDDEGRFTAVMLPILPFPDGARTALVVEWAPPAAPLQRCTLPRTSLPPGEVDLGDLRLAATTRCN